MMTVHYIMMVLHCAIMIVYYVMISMIVHYVMMVLHCAIIKVYYVMMIVHYV